MFGGCREDTVRDKALRWLPGFCLASEEGDSGLLSSAVFKSERRVDFNSVCAPAYVFSIICARTLGMCRITERATNPTLFSPRSSRNPSYVIYLLLPQWMPDGPVYPGKSRLSGLAQLISSESLNVPGFRS